MVVGMAVGSFFEVGGVRSRRRVCFIHAKADHLNFLKKITNRKFESNISCKPLRIQLLNLLLRINLFLFSFSLIKYFVYFIIASIVLLYHCFYNQLKWSLIWKLLLNQLTRLLTKTPGYLHLCSCPPC